MSTLDTNLDLPMSDRALTPLLVQRWGRLDYQSSLDHQNELVRKYLEGDERDRIILVEHPPTITLGRRGSTNDLHFPEKFYQDRGICLQKVNRGGLATAHEPGQLVAYPILRVKKKNIKLYAETFLNVIVRLLGDYGVQGYLKPGEPGVWVNGQKICSFGIGLKRWISYHGIALNINNDLETFKMIVPCGRPDEIVTSLQAQVGFEPDMDVIYDQFLRHFCKAFDYFQVKE